MCKKEAYYNIIAFAISAGDNGSNKNQIMVIYTDSDGTNTQPTDQLHIQDPPQPGQPGILANGILRSGMYTGSLVDTLKQAVVTCSGYIWPESNTGNSDSIQYRR